MAEEKIKIVELDMGIDGLIAKGAQSKEVIVNIGNYLKNLRSEQRANAKEMEILNKELDELEKKGDGNSESAKKYKKRLEELRVAQKQNIKQTTELDAKLKANRQTYNLHTKNIIAHSKAHLDSLDVIKKTDGSITQLEAALANNKKIYKALTKEQRENAEVGGELLKIISEQRKEYNDLKEDLGENQHQVGSYTEAIIEASKETTIFTKIQAHYRAVTAPLIPMYRKLKSGLNDVWNGYRNAAAGTKGLSTAQKIATISSNLFSNSLKLLRIALISTGIGAIVVALGALFAWFTRVQKGADKLAQVIAGVGAAIKAVVDTIARIGGAIWGFITGQKSLSEAWNEGKSALAGMTEEMRKEYELAVKLERKLQQLAKAEVLLDIQRAASKRRMKELNKIAEDTTKTIEERIDALETSAKIEEDLMRRTVRMAKDRLAIELGQIELTKEGEATLQRFRDGTISANEALASLGISESMLEDLEKFRDLFVDFENKQAELFELQTTRQNKLNTLINEQKRLEEQKTKEAIELQKKKTQEAIRQMEIELKIFIESQGVKAKSLEDEILLAEEVAAKQLAINKKKLDGKLMSQKEYDLEFLKLQNELNEAYNKLIDDTYQRELDSFIKMHQSKLDANKFFSDELYKQELDRLALIEKARKEHLDKRLKLGTISESEYNDAIDEINENFRLQREELQLQRETAENEKRAVDRENKRIIEQEQLETEHERQLFRLNLMYEAELKHAEKTGADTKLITQKYAIAKQKIDEAAAEAKMNANAAAFGEIAGFLGEETAIGKVAALAQAAINIQQGITKAMASKGFAGIAQGVIIAAKGASAVARISGVNTSFDSGGKVDVPTGIGGRITGQNIPTQRGGDNILANVLGTDQMVTVQNGEIILNNQQQRNAQMIAGPDFFRRIGVPGLNTGGVAGSITQSAIAQSVSSFRSSNSKIVDEEKLARLIGDYVVEGNKELPPPQMDLIAFGEAQNELNSVINGASG